MNKIEPLGENELLPIGQRAEMDTRFLGPAYRASSNLYLLSFEVDEPTWLQFKASVPKGAIVSHQFFWHNGDEGEQIESETTAEKPKRQKKEPKEKGSHGPYWQAMYKSGFQHSLDIQAVLDVKTALEVKEALRREFAVDSLTFVSPDKFETWAETKNLHGLVAMSRQATQ